MKHTWSITIILTVLFFVAQIVGLGITNEYLSKDLPFGIERPEIESSVSYIPIVIAIVIATAIALFLIRLNAMKLWKFWFIFATVYLLSIAFNAFLDFPYGLIAALVLGILKFIRPSVVIHNLVELFVYSGIAAIFVPIMNLMAVIILLAIISVYDYVAVWKTKHMVKMAEFQTKAKVFAGLLIPYKKGKKFGVLGGGDIGFTMLFSGVVLSSLGFLQGVITALFATIALFLLFIFSKEKHYYPAMPFLTAGCLIGLLVSYLV